MEVHELLRRVSDEASFLEFAEALLSDRLHAERAEALKPSSPYGPDAGGWVNTSISHFLESAISWAEDTSFGSTQGQAPKENPWQAFATFLYLGKIYE